jgi:peptide/nickel transport system substrate-binding protein
VDLVSYIRPLDTLSIAESAFAKVVKSKDVTAFYGFINQRKKGSKWKDIRMRRAINCAINRNELFRYGAKGNAYNLGGLIPPGAYGYNPNLTLYSYDTSKAKRLLSEAGYPDGFKLKMIAHEAWNLEAQIIGRMLERVGIEVEIEVLRFSEMMRKHCVPLLEKPPEQQDWDISTWSSGDWCGHPAASLLTYGLLEDGQFRWIEYDAEYEEMWKDMVGTVEPASEERKISRMMQYVYDKAYFLFIYSPLSLYAVNKEVNFVPPKLVFLRLKDTSVTDRHWSLRGKNN